jgi:hypothetical protein
VQQPVLRDGCILDVHDSVLCRLEIPEHSGDAPADGRNRRRTRQMLTAVEHLRLALLQRAKQKAPLEAPIEEGARRNERIRQACGPGASLRFQILLHGYLRLKHGQGAHRRLLRVVPELGREEAPNTRGDGGVNEHRLARDAGRTNGRDERVDALEGRGERRDGGVVDLANANAGGQVWGVGGAGEDDDGEMRREELLNDGAADVSCGLSGFTVCEVFDHLAHEQWWTYPCDCNSRHHCLSTRREDSGSSCRSIAT